MKPPASATATRRIRVLPRGWANPRFPRFVSCIGRTVRHRIPRLLPAADHAWRYAPSSSLIGWTRSSRISRQARCLRPGSIEGLIPLLWLVSSGGIVGSIRVQGQVPLGLGIVDLSSRWNHSRMEVAWRSPCRPFEVPTCSLDSSGVREGKRKQHRVWTGGWGSIISGSE